MSQKGSFKEFQRTIGTQNDLRSSGFYPLGWSKKDGRLIWSTDPSGSICNVVDDQLIDERKIVVVDHVNAILILD